MTLETSSAIVNEHQRCFGVATEVEVVDQEQIFAVERSLIVFRVACHSLPVGNRCNSPWVGLGAFAIREHLWSGKQRVLLRVVATCESERVALNLGDSSNVQSGAAKGEVFSILQRESHALLCHHF